MSVRFTLKELRCEFSSSFDIISDYVWNEKKMRVKENNGHRSFFINKKAKVNSTI